MRTPRPGETWINTDPDVGDVGEAYTVLRIYEEASAYRGDFVAIVEAVDDCNRLCRFTIDEFCRTAQPADFLAGPPEGPADWGAAAMSEEACGPF